MAYDERREWRLDTEAYAVTLWLDRRDGWEDADTGDIRDPILRWMADEAKAAPVATTELEWRAYRHFDAGDVADRISRVRWAREDPDPLERLRAREARLRYRPGIDPFIVRREDARGEESLRPVIIDGLLRRGETCNVIAPPKIGKSWLVHGLAIDLCCGTPWIGRATTPSRVLLIDNELHEETLRYRLSESIGRTGRDPGERLEALSLRGHLKDLYQVCDWLNGYPAGQWDVVICDAWYRMLPQGTSENANAEMAALYNHLDRTADQCGIAFLLVHHSSKGNQSDKAVTDVGAGAGSMARAADCHLVLRRHREENCVVLEAAARSFPPPEPQVLEWSFPRWVPRTDLDPADLDDGMPPSSADQWPLERVAAELIGPSPQALAAVKAALRGRGCSERHARSVVKAIEAARTISVIDQGKDRLVYRVPDR